MKKITDLPTNFDDDIKLTDDTVFYIAGNYDTRVKPVRLRKLKEYLNDQR